MHQHFLLSKLAARVAKRPLVAGQWLFRPKGAWKLQAAAATLQALRIVLHSRLWWASFVGRLPTNGDGTPHEVWTLAPHGDQSRKALKLIEVRHAA